MAKSMDLVKMTRDVVIEDKNKIYDSCSTVYEDSLLCLQDIKTNEPELLKIQTEVENFQGAVNRIIKWIENDTCTEFNNAKSRLSNISMSLYNYQPNVGILERIRTVSEELWNEKHKEFEKNYEYFEGVIKSVNSAIKSYDDFKSEKSRLKTEINKALTVTERGNIQARINKIDKNMDYLVDDAQKRVNELRDKNLLNKELVTQFLQKQV